jgi:hypothetical protein
MEFTWFQFGLYGLTTAVAASHRGLFVRVLGILIGGIIGGIVSQIAFAVVVSALIANATAPMNLIDVETAGIVAGSFGGAAAGLVVGRLMAR